MKLKNIKIFIIIALISIVLILLRHFLCLNAQVDTFNNTKYNLAFYTCFYGSSNNVAFKIPEIPSNKYPCYYFSNNMDLLNKLEGTKWIGVHDNKPVTDDSIESCFYGKRVKVVPDDFIELKDYDYTCFLDSKLDKVSETFVEEFIENYFIKDNFALLLREHVSIKDNVWNEYNESMKQERYVSQKQKYTTYINKQIQNGLSETVKKHCQCGFLIRNMNHPKISEINKTWYSHIEECGIQDQISFFFVKQLFDEYIYPFKEIPFIS
jgi:hypothetical protein